MTVPGRVSAAGNAAGSKRSSDRTSVSAGWPGRGGIGGIGMGAGAAGSAGIAATTGGGGGESKIGASTGLSTGSGDATGPSSVATASGGVAGIGVEKLPGVESSGKPVPDCSAKPGAVGTTTRAGGVSGAGMIIGSVGARSADAAGGGGAIGAASGSDGAGIAAIGGGAGGAGAIGAGGWLARPAMRCPCTSGELARTMATVVTSAAIVPAMVGVSNGVGRNFGPSAEIAANRPAIMNRPKAALASMPKLALTPVKRARNTMQTATLTASARATIKAPINISRTRSHQTRALFYAFFLPWAGFRPLRMYNNSKKMPQQQGIR